jgi:hypothetical protein
MRRLSGATWHRPHVMCLDEPTSVSFRCDTSLKVVEGGVLVIIEISPSFFSRRCGLCVMNVLRLLVTTGWRVRDLVLESTGLLGRGGSILSDFEDEGVSGDSQERERAIEAY